MLCKRNGYNEHGSMAAMPHLQNMQWDFAERLSHVTKGTMEAYYNYDGSGERVRKVVEKGNITEERIYLGGFEIFRKKENGTLKLERETLHVMDGYEQAEEDAENETSKANNKRRIAIVETKTWENGSQIANPIPAQRYQLGNHIESASLELDETASIISYEEYYPYGDTSYQAGRSMAEVGLKRYRYTGKEKDEESGLYYHGARYYASWLRRWTAADPIGLVDGVNLYMYCRGNPVAFVDPSGMTAWIIPNADKSIENVENIESDRVKNNSNIDYNENAWILSEGNKVYWYVGEYGNTEQSDLKRVFEASSGKKIRDEEITDNHNNVIMKRKDTYQRAKFHDIKEKGPTVEGEYKLTLSLEYKIAEISESVRLKRNTKGGIEQIPNDSFFKERWGNKRIRMEFVSVKEGVDYKDRDPESFYIHDSDKEETSGCIEIESAFFEALEKYTEAGKNSIRVKVEYPSKNHKTGR